MRNFLITGATSGIGKGICISLLQQGERVIGIGRDVTKVSDVLEQFQSSFHFVSIDLNLPLENISEIDTLLNGFGKIHGMVYCAGKEETLPLSSYSHEKVNDIFNVNFHGAFQLLRMFSKKKSCHDGASFVFLSSIMGELGQPGKTAYCSSKAAIIGLVRAAALELASRGIRVNSVSPGVVETPMTAHLFSIIGKEKEREIKSMHPLGFGKVDDIVSLISFLLSDNSKWITGQNFKIDGGYSIK